MVFNKIIAEQLAKQLLQIKAIELNYDTPFQWASGIKAPIYCDNRKALSYPQTRKFITNAFVKIIKEEYNKVDLIAGVATGGIAYGALVANELDLPFIYVRDKAKGYGKKNRIEGSFSKGQRAIVIEDLISTGGSSISVVQALKEVDIEVVGLGAIFSYNFLKAKVNFEQNKCSFFTISSYENLLEVANLENYISAEEKEKLKQFMLNPDSSKALFS